MDKKLAGLLGAMGALAAVSPAGAQLSLDPTLADVMHAGTYADLLRPIPNAAAMLQASNLVLSEAPPAVVLTQYHHHRYIRRRHRHHHHHHHHHHSMVVFPNAPRQA